MIRTEKESHLQRYEGNPIITPDDVPSSNAVFNCGQTLYHGKTVLLLSVGSRGTSMSKPVKPEASRGAGCAQTSIRHSD